MLIKPFVQAGAARPVNAARFLLGGHLFPATLVALYLAPAVLGLYAFRDIQAQRIAGALLVSVLCYYGGFYGAARAQRTWRTLLSPDQRRFSFAPRTLQNAALATLSVYGLLVLYLVVTSRDVAILAALRSADVAEITAAREAFVQTRTGAESIVRYVNALFIRVLVPFSVVILYAHQHRWRHFALVAILLCSLLSLEKSLTAFILVPLGIYFLLTGRARAVGAFVLAGSLIVAATILGTGALSDLRGATATVQTPFLTDLAEDRKNVLWLLSWLTDHDAGQPLHDVLERNRPSFAVSADGRVIAKKDTSVDHAKSPGMATDADGSAWRAGKYRNLLVNGDIRVSEHGPGRALTFAGTSEVATRWLAALSVSKVLSFEQSSDAPEGFTRSLKVNVITAYEPKSGEIFELQQRVEGFKVADLGFGSRDAATMALSFWIKASRAGYYNVTIANGRGTRSYLARYDVIEPDRWEHKVIIAVVDPAGSADEWPERSAEALLVNFSFGAGSAYRSNRLNEWQGGFFRQSAANVVTLVREAGATLFLTGVQLEAGAAATPFEQRSSNSQSSPETRRRFIGLPLVEALPDWAERHLTPVVRDPRAQVALRRMQFIVNRVVWVPYITAYDWLRFHHEVLEDRRLLGRTIGIVSYARGTERYPVENEVFKYQYGVFATPTATANAVYFADAYLNFGWTGVIIYSLLIGAIFYLLAASGSLPLLAVSVMSVFSLMIASFPANLLSGGLFLLLLLALVFREPPTQARAV